MSESKTQKSIVNYFRYIYPKGICFAIPNGGTRNIREAMVMKSTGTLAGVSDLIIILPNGKLIFVEVKYGKNKQSESQKEFQQRVEKLGYEYWVVYSLDEFISKI